MPRQYEELTKPSPLFALDSCNLTIFMSLTRFIARSALFAHDIANGLIDASALVSRTAKSRTNLQSMPPPPSRDGGAGAPTPIASSNPHLPPPRDFYLGPVFC